MVLLNDWTIAAWMGGSGMAAFGGVIQGSRLLKQKLTLRAELKRKAEIEAYAELDPALAPREAPRVLARRVCTTVAKHSPFKQVAMFMPDADKRLHMAGSSGVDDLEAIAVVGKVARFACDRRRRLAAQEREFNQPLTLEINDASLPVDEAVKQVIVIPMWSHAGEMMGALALWRRVAAAKNGAVEEIASKELLGPVQGLAEKLGRSMDLNRMSARLLGSERLAMVSRVGRLSVI